MAKLVYALALGASGAIHESSSLSARTYYFQKMLNFLHNFNPSPVMVSWGMIKIYWYGFFIVLGFFVAFAVLNFLVKKYKLNKDNISDLVFYLFVFGLVGARVYDILLEWRYYLQHPLNIFKIWEGGLAIHGGIIAGVLVIWFFIKKKKIKGLDSGAFFDFFKLSSLIVCVLPLAQAIGRLGNYFNQELFGLPTLLPWGIFISPENRPLRYINYSFFHPTFLYEALGDLLIFVILFFIHLWLIKKNKFNFKNSFLIVALYLVLYSILRFSLEFIRIDFAPTILGWRFPQIVSFVIILLVLITFVILKKKNKFNN